MPNLKKPLKKRRAEQSNGFTDDEMTQIVQAVQTTWNYVAYDTIQMCGGKCSRAVAIEMSVDADRPVEIGKLDVKLYRRLCILSNKELTKLLAPVFRFANYAL